MQYLYLLFLLFIPPCFFYFIFKRRFILCALGNAMRFSLRNSLVEIRFLYLRGLFMLFLRFCNTPPAISAILSTRNPRKKPAATKGIPIYPSTLVIHVSMSIPVCLSDLLLSREKIDRSSSPLTERFVKFSFFEFTLSYRLQIFSRWLFCQRELVTNASSGRVIGTEHLFI